MKIHKNEQNEQNEQAGEDKENNAPDFLVEAKRFFDRRDDVGEDTHEKELKEAEKRKFKIIK